MNKRGFIYEYKRAVRENRYHFTSSFRRWLIIVLSLQLVSGSCVRNVHSDPWNRTIVLPTSMSGDHFNVVIENPAGESFQVYYNPQNETLDTLVENGVPTGLSFLPFPVNTGFIPAPDPATGEFRRIDVFVLGKRLNPGKSYLVNPMALMSFYEAGAQRDIVLAVPFDEEYKLIPATSFQNLLFEYDPLKFAIQHWITYRKGLGSVHTFRWSDERVATMFLEKKLSPH
jgi:inorganic pyrophosphatase